MSNFCVVYHVAPFGQVLTRIGKSCNRYSIVISFIADGKFIDLTVDGFKSFEIAKACFDELTFNDIKEAVETAANDLV
jgi:hypothetical protein